MYSKCFKKASCLLRSQLQLGGTVPRTHISWAFFSMLKSPESGTLRGQTPALASETMLDLRFLHGFKQRFN